MSASNSDQLLETGWLGRYLQGQHPAFPDGYPGPDNPDPLAIQIGSVVPLALMGNTVPMGMAIADPTAYYQFVNDIAGACPDRRMVMKRNLFVSYLSRRRCIISLSKVLPMSARTSPAFTLHRGKITLPTSCALWLN